MSVQCSHSRNFEQCMLPQGHSAGHAAPSGATWAASADDPAPTPWSGIACDRHTDAGGGGEPVEDCPDCHIPAPAAGTKRNHGKRRWATLLPLAPLGLAVDAFEAGLGKEDRKPGDWRAAVRAEGGRLAYRDALMRHAIGAVTGNGMDDGEDGSGLPHLAHLVATGLILLWDWQQDQGEAGPCR